MEDPQQPADNEEAPLMEKSEGIPEAITDDEFKQAYREWKLTRNYTEYTTDGEPSDARDENFCQSVGWFCCPKLSCGQFITIITLFEFVVFGFTLWLGGIDNSAFLAPGPYGLAWGWSDTKKIRNEWQLWRFFTPTILHGHLEHIVGNSVAAIFMGGGIESGIGFFRMIFLYVLSGLGGITLSMCIRPNAHGVGASTAVFGLVGFLVSYIFTNFYYMRRIRFSQLIFLISYCTLIIVMNMNVGPNADPRVDNWGHLGGFITGTIIGCSISEQYDANARDKDRTPDRFTNEEYQERSGCCSFFNRFCQVILILWFLCLFIYFYAYMDIEFEDEDEGV